MSYTNEAIKAMGRDTWELYQRIKPLIKVDGELKPVRFLAKEELSSMSYAWLSAAPHSKQPTIELIGIFMSRHTYGSYGMFKPDVHEVLSQMPHELLKHAKYFWVDGPNDTNDLNRQWKSVGVGYHCAACYVYDNRD